MQYGYEKFSSPLESVFNSTYNKNVSRTARELTLTPEYSKNSDLLTSHLSQQANERIQPHKAEYAIVSKNKSGKRQILKTLEFYRSSVVQIYQMYKMLMWETGGTCNSLLNPEQWLKRIKKKIRKKTHQIVIKDIYFFLVSSSFLQKFQRLNSFSQSPTFS